MFCQFDLQILGLLRKEVAHFISMAKDLILTYIHMEKIDRSPQVLSI